ncbi:hypothetical protein [Streptomyces sp. Tue6028]|uniref:hypothetical protein n=1 Tax=Streptomyces sp. Tue6028 TaxID=2036037 RepID=UPI003D751426
MPLSAVLSGAASRVTREAAGRRALQLALLMGGLFAVALLCGERAQAADGTVPGPAAGVVRSTADAVHHVLAPRSPETGTEAVRDSEGASEPAATVADEGRVKSTAKSDSTAEAKPTDRSKSTAGTAPVPAAAVPAPATRTTDGTRVPQAAPGTPASHDTRAGRPAPAVDGALAPVAGVVTHVTDTVTDTVRHVVQPVDDLVRPATGAVVRPVGDLVETVTGGLPETPPDGLPSVPGLPGLPDLPALPPAGAQPLPAGSVPPAHGAAAQNNRPATAGQHAARRQHAPSAGPVFGPGTHGADVWAGAPRRAHDGVPTLQSPARQAPADDTTGVLIDRSAVDNGAPRHGDPHAITPVHRAPLRLVPGASAAVTAAETRDRYRDIPVFPG